jgi:hypothetical protein
MMSAVELWKAQQPPSRQRPSTNHLKWRTVGIAENCWSPAHCTSEIKIPCTRLNRFSPFSPKAIHRASDVAAILIFEFSRTAVQAIMQGMLSSRPEFTRLEQSVLNAICEMHPKDRAALEAQLTTATFLRRENTGAGFYTYFTVQQRHGRVEGERLRTGPAAKVAGLKNGMGLSCGSGKATPIASKAIVTTKAQRGSTLNAWSSS